jgi:hypothetical protein
MTGNGGCCVSLAAIWRQNKEVAKFNSLKRNMLSKDNLSEQKRKLDGHTLE